MIHTILVPQGAEYKAVCRGLRICKHKPVVLSIPAGTKPLSKYLQNYKWQEHFQNYPQPKVLLMGLCGGLNPRHSVGDIVLYEDCVYRSDNHSNLIMECDRSLTQQLYSHFQEKVSLVKGLTSDGVVFSANEKQRLAEISGASVVDMEGFVALDFFRQIGVSVAMLRVVSDDCKYDLPDLSQVFDANGFLKPSQLATAMLQQPIAATRLIRGSLRGLQVLEEVSKQLVMG